MDTPDVIVKDIMSEDVVVVFPDTSLVDAAKLLSHHKFNGLPVVNEENKLAGIITEYDLITNGTMMHIPTLQKIWKDATGERETKNSELRVEVDKIMDFCVKDVMNKEPMTILETTSYEEALKIFASHHRVNPIPVLNEKQELVGVISRIDILKPLMKAR